MMTKGEASKLLPRYIKSVKKQTRADITAVHMDSGSKFSRVERVHCIILSNERAYRKAKLPRKYWCYAVLHAVDCKTVIQHNGKSNYRSPPCLVIHPPTFVISARLDSTSYRVRCTRIFRPLENVSRRAYAFDAKVETPTEYWPTDVLYVLRTSVISRPNFP